MQYFRAFIQLGDFGASLLSSAIKNMHRNYRRYALLNICKKLNQPLYFPSVSVIIKVTMAEGFPMVLQIVSVTHFFKIILEV